MASPSSTNRNRDGGMRQQAAAAVTKVMTGAGSTTSSRNGRNPLVKRGILTKSSSASSSSNSTAQGQVQAQAGGLSKQHGGGSSSARSTSSGGNSDSPSSVTGGMIIPQSSNSSSSSSPASSKGSESSNISDIIPLLHGDFHGLQRTNSNGSSASHQHHAASSPGQAGCLGSGGVMTGGVGGAKVLGGTARKLKAIAESEAISEANTAFSSGTARVAKPNYGPVPFTYAQVRHSLSVHLYQCTFILSSFCDRCLLHSFFTALNRMCLTMLPLWP